GPEESGRRLHRPAQRSQGLCQADRDQGDGAAGLLPGGGLSPGLPDAAPQPALYCLQRPAEDREPEEAVCRKLHREADAGGQRERLQLSASPEGVFMSDTKATDKVVKSEAEWRKELTPMQYAVLREKATERPFTGEYEYETKPGTYVCAGCGQTLFESDAKFDSGCGWPSFTQPAVEGHIDE